jgi:hypothetical protein
MHPPLRPPACASDISTGALALPASADTTSTLNTVLGAAAPVGGGVLYNHYHHKSQQARDERDRNGRGQGSGGRDGNGDCNGYHNGDHNGWSNNRGNDPGGDGD